MRNGERGLASDAVWLVGVRLRDEEFALAWW